MLCYSDSTGTGNFRFRATPKPITTGIPMLKAVIVVLMLAVIASLFSGLFFLIRDGGKTNRVVNSLAVRVALSILLLAIILIALWQGSLTLNPTP